MGSAQGKFSAGDTFKVFRDLLIVLAAAVVTWLLDSGLQLFQDNQWLPPAIVTVLAALLSAIRRWLSDTRPET